MRAKFTLSIVLVFIQILILSLIVINIASCELPLKWADNRTIGFDGLSCGSSCGFNGGSTCGSSKCGEVTIPSIEYTPPSPKGSPPKPPELVDGNTLPSGTTETGGVGTSGGGGGGARRR